MTRVFTRQFLIVAPGLIVYEPSTGCVLRKQICGVRDFATSDVQNLPTYLFLKHIRETVFASCAAMCAAKWKSA